MTPYESYADEVLGRARAAAEAFKKLDQSDVDRIVEAAFRAAFDARIELARLAADETGIGVFEHKVLKNAWASLLIYEQIRGRRTTGVVAQDAARGITEIANPVGPVLAITPLTNPTSTVIFKALICLKTRNPMILSPHRAARKCSREAARIVGEAAVLAGAPPESIQVITKAQIEYLDAIMAHRRLAFILATSTQSIVRRAQASGTPTYGVGPGNVPVYVHHSADLEFAARMIVHSKTFDNGTVCASEQALIAEPDVAERIRPLLVKRGAYFCTPAEARALGPVCFDAEAPGMRAEVVGQPAAAIASRAGFAVPEKTRLLIAEMEGIGPGHPLSYEILAPVLAYHRVPDYATALDTCRRITHLGGIGHTIGLYANDDRVIADFATMDAARILLNTPTTEGALGGTYNHLPPSLTLACGPSAKNVNADNITIDHLLTIHRVAAPRPNESWLGIPKETLLDPATDARTADRLYHKGG